MAHVCTGAAGLLRCATLLSAGVLGVLFVLSPGRLAFHYSATAIRQALPKAYGPQAAPGQRHLVRVQSDLWEGRLQQRSLIPINQRSGAAPIVYHRPELTLQAGSQSSSFRTEIDIPATSLLLQPDSGVVLIGSCFSENIGTRLALLKVPTQVNPFGIAYNPLSIAATLQRLLSGQPFCAADLTTDGVRFFSYQHHSSFSRRTETEALQGMNAARVAGAAALRRAAVVVLTFGSAWAYVLRSSGQVVANCHKMPQALFTRRLIEADEMVAAVLAAIHAWRAVNPQLRVILTVSPVRHLKDGALENSLSKATLVVAAHALARRLPKVVTYFPAYELMLDDLRDYRFYEEDMLHPSGVAVDYIWRKFADAYFNAPSRALFAQVAAVQAAAGHRPFDPGAPAHQAFLLQQLEKVAALEAAHPHMDFTAERATFQAQLLP